MYIGYCRVSTPDQKENGTGIERQRNLIDEYVNKKGEEVVGWYIDDFTGTKEDRPELLRFFMELEELQTIDDVILVVESSDRLARDLMVQEILFTRFLSKNIRVFSVKQNAFLTDENPNTKFLRQIMGAMAEFDKVTLVNRLRAGRAAKKRQDILNGGTGKVEGKKGYREICRNIYDEVVWLKNFGHKSFYGEKRIKKMTNREIANIMNDYGYKTLSDKSFTRDIIRSILKTAGL